MSQFAGFNLGKRTRNPYLAAEESSGGYPDSTGRPSSTSGSASTARRSKQKRADTLDKRYAEEEKFLARFPHLKFLGRQRQYRSMSSRPSFASPDPFLTEFVSVAGWPLPNFNPDEFVFVKTSSLVQLNHLERFSHPPHTLDPAHESVVLAAADYVRQLLSSEPPMPFPSVSDLEDVRFQGDKFPGIEYAWQGYSSRAEADTVAQADAEAAWLQLMAGEAVRPHLNRMGGRGKMARKVDVEALGEKLDKGRLILMTSQRDLKLNGVTEQLLTSRFKHEAYPVAVGQSWWHGGCERFLERFRPFSKLLCFDAKKYDASLPGWLIRIAINILRGQFVDGHDSRFDAYWNFVYDGLVRAPVFLDNGLTFERADGSTSGHSHNTLVQSVCTLILGYAGVFAEFPEEVWEEVTSHCWFESLGDDQIGGLADFVAAVTKEKIVANVWRIFRVDWGGDKSFETGMLVDETPGGFDGIQFLGKYFRILDRQVEATHFTGVIPYRPTEETLTRLLYPEHYAEGPQAAWERAVGHYADAAGNDVTREWLDKYLDWLEPQVTFPDVVWSEKWRRKFTGGDPLDDVPVPGRRLLYHEWLRLVLV